MLRRKGGKSVSKGHFLLNSCLLPLKEIPLRVLKELKSGWPLNVNSRESEVSVLIQAKQIRRPLMTVMGTLLHATETGIN